MGEWDSGSTSASLPFVDHAVIMCASWRNPESYRHLLDADRSLFAWEWLRRDPAYRIAAKGGLPTEDGDARQFGLVRFEAPDATVPRARPLWRSEISPQVLLAEVANGATADQVFDIGRFSHMASLVSERDTDHLLLCDGLRAIRLDAPLGTFSSKRMSVRFRVGGLMLGDLSVLALRRLLALVRCGRFAHSLHRREPRATRWILQLRTHDALVAGADLREIAEELLGRSAAGPGWRTRDPSLRSQAQRMVHSARAMANGGFRNVLAGSVRRRSAPGLDQDRSADEIKTAELREREWI